MIWYYSMCAIAISMMIAGFGCLISAFYAFYKKIINKQYKEEDKGRFKAGRWLARFEDLPEPENIVTENMGRMLRKLQRITREIEDWNCNTNSRDTILNKDDITIEIRYECGERGSEVNGKYYFGNYRIKVCKGEETIDLVVIPYNHSIWGSSINKKTKGAKIIDNISLMR